MPKMSTTNKRSRTINNPCHLNTYIKRVLGWIHRDITISTTAVEIINTILCQVGKNIVVAANELCKLKNTKTLQAKTIEMAIQVVMPDELSKHGISEGNKAMIKYSTNMEEEREGRINGKIYPQKRIEKKCGLILPVSKIEKMILENRGIYISQGPYSNIGLPDKKYKPFRKNKGAAVFLTAVLEYVCEEILELAGNALSLYHANYRETWVIQPRDIEMACRDDEELNTLLHSQILGGGVYPNIHPYSLPEFNVLHFMGGSGQVNEDCPVCFEALDGEYLENGPSVDLLCNHKLHQECRDGIISSGRYTRCPLCRTNFLEKNDEDYSEEGEDYEEESGDDSDEREDGWNWGNDSEEESDEYDYSRQDDIEERQYNRVEFDMKRLTIPIYKRILASGGVIGYSHTLYEVLRRITSLFLEKILKKSLINVKFENSKTLLLRHVVKGSKDAGVTAYYSKNFPGLRRPCKGRNKYLSNDGVTFRKKPRKTSWWSSEDIEQRELLELWKEENPGSRATKENGYVTMKEKILENLEDFSEMDDSEIWGKTDRNRKGVTTVGMRRAFLKRRYSGKREKYSLNLARIRQMQHNTCLIFPKKTFQDLVASKSNIYIYKIRISKAASLFIQSITENYLIKLAEIGKMFSLHGNRITLLPKDLELAVNINMRF